MPGAWADILDRLGATASPGASPDDILLFEQDAGVTLPSDLRDLLLTADGADISNPYVRLLPLDEMRQYVPMLLGGEPGSRLGYVAFTDSNDSNPFCVCTRGTLQGFVVRVNHDDDTRVCFRSLPGFFRALERAASNGGADALVDDLETDFPRNHLAATQDDDRRASELLAAADTFDRDADERLWLIVLAMQMLSPGRVAEVAGYLDDSVFVRRLARQTLAEIGTPEAREAIKGDDRELAAFTDGVVDALAGAGVTVAEVQRGGTINVGRRWFDLNFWFGRRRDGDVLREVVESVKSATH